jgi:hypothetical protein
VRTQEGREERDTLDWYNTRSANENKNTKGKEKEEKKRV